MKLYGRNFDMFIVICGLIGCYIRHDEMIILYNTLRDINWFVIFSNVQISDTTLVIWTICICTGLILGKIRSRN